MLDLTQPRVFAISEGGRNFTLTVKPITKEMWLKYFAGIVSTSEVERNGDSESSYDSSGARVELLESALIDATGYTPEDQPITNIDGWQARLPMRHRRAVADLLVAVEVVPPEDGADYVLGVETVVLKATWSADDRGRMQEISGLQHFFSSPTAEHQKRYSRAISRSVVEGGSRTGRTRWVGAQDVLIELYEELCVMVKGYCAFQADYCAPKDMDTYHKVAAATALFTPAQIQ